MQNLSSVKGRQVYLKSEKKQFRIFVKNSQGIRNFGYYDCYRSAVSHAKQLATTIDADLINLHKGKKNEQS